MHLYAPVMKMNLLKYVNYNDIETASEQFKKHIKHPPYYK